MKCGKKCKRLRGLKDHQRSWRTIKTLCNEVLDDLNSNNRTDQQEEITIDENIVNEHANLNPIRPGLFSRSPGRGGGGGGQRPGCPKSKLTSTDWN